MSVKILILVAPPWLVIYTFPRLPPRLVIYTSVGLSKGVRKKRKKKRTWMSAAAKCDMQCDLQYSVIVVVFPQGGDRRWWDQECLYVVKPAGLQDPSTQ